MSEIEKIFDINRILKKIYLLVENSAKSKNIELIYSMGTSIPRELRGNEEALEALLSKVLSFVFEHTTKNEVVLSLHAPEDFLYEESISFKIDKTSIVQQTITRFLFSNEISTLLSLLNGKVIEEHDGEICIEIPFTIGELGFRRHYRLPSKSMLEKKVLLIIESANVTQSIMDMFKYFPYDVQVGFKEFQSHQEDLEHYDVIIVEDKLLDTSMAKLIIDVQMETDIKYVLLGNEENITANLFPDVSMQLLKPVTQESIFELIISLFSKDGVEKKKTDRRKEPRESLPLNDTAILEVSKTMNKNDAIYAAIEEKKQEASMVLDTRAGLENAKKLNVIYSDELKVFLDMFNKSDLYFREIVLEKSINKIKEFCIDLEKQSKIIGAESMLKFAETINLIFVYNKLDILPIYPGRYHIELRKLVNEIKKYLHI